MAKLKRALILLMVAVLCGVGLLWAAYFGNRYMEKRTYTLAYPKEIGAAAKEFDLDPYLVAAMIHVESGGQSKAVSPKGAVGLMQIMPDTGGWIAHKLTGEPEADFDSLRLYDPATNIRFGCWYLRFLLDRYAGVLTPALSAYNAGHGNVDKWLADARFTSNGTLLNIPFAETEAYVGKVARARDKYKELYAEELS